MANKPPLHPQTQPTMITIRRDGKVYQDVYELPLNANGDPIITSDLAKMIDKELGPCPGCIATIGR